MQVCAFRKFRPFSMGKICTRNLIKLYKSLRIKCFPVVYFRGNIHVATRQAYLFGLHVLFFGWNITWQLTGPTCLAYEHRMSMRKSTLEFLFESSDLTRFLSSKLRWRNKSNIISVARDWTAEDDGGTKWKLAFAFLHTLSSFRAYVENYYSYRN